MHSRFTKVKTIRKTEHGGVKYTTKKIEKKNLKDESRKTSQNGIKHFLREHH